MGIIRKFKRPVGRPTKHVTLNLPSKLARASTSLPTLSPKSDKVLAPPPNFLPKFCLVCKFECDDRFEYCSECFKVADEYFRVALKNEDKNEINNSINEPIGQTPTVTCGQVSQTNYSHGPQLTAYEQNHTQFIGTSFTTYQLNNGGQAVMMNYCQNQNPYSYPYQSFMQLLMSKDPVSVMEMSDLANVIDMPKIPSQAKPRIITFKVTKNNQNNNEVQYNQTSYKRDVEGHAMIPQEYLYSKDQINNFLENLKGGRGKSRNHPIIEMDENGEVIKRPVGRPKIVSFTFPTECEEMAKRGRGRPRLIPKRGRGRPRIHPFREDPMKISDYDNDYNEKRQRGLCRPIVYPITEPEDREADEEQEEPPAKRARGRPRIHLIQEKSDMIGDADDDSVKVKRSRTLKE